jgi:small subunit ribosomal protein S1
MSENIETTIVDEVAADTTEENAEAVVVVEVTETEVVAEVVEVDEVVAEVTETEVVAEVVEADEAVAEATAEPTDSSDRVVRVLSVGMEVPGVVKRTTDFGAFVDIGVGRDGLIHISELSARRVAKVSDVVKEGQEVTAWIKELDRSRNRISLTLIAPGTKTIRDLEKDEIVTGTVSRVVPYGAFVDIGVGRDALLHIREMAVGYVNKPEDVVQVGETIEARIIEVSRRRGRIDLSLKGLRPEPEVEQPAGKEAQVVEEEEELEDPFANMEVLSPMELAFQKAMGDESEEVEGMTKKRSKRARRDQMRAIQDEIVSRTLDGSERG